MVTVGGVVGIALKSYKIGDIVEGNLEGNGFRVQIAPHSPLNDAASPSSYDESILIPGDYLQAAEGDFNINDPGLPDKAPDDATTKSTTVSTQTNTLKKVFFALIIAGLTGLIIYALSNHNQ